MDYHEIVRWARMIDRCHNPDSRSYRNYGGRGIEVCRRWHDYGKFFEDVGLIPDGLSLDRIDNDGDYSPDNIRLADRITQANNRRSCRYISHQGRDLTVAQWAREKGINAATIRDRHVRGWEPAEIFGRPVQASEPIMLNGVTLTVGAWSRESGLHVKTLTYRISQGWDDDDILSPDTEKFMRVEHEGRTLTLDEWAVETGIKRHTIFTRLNSGWSPSEALTTPAMKREVEVDGEIKSISGAARDLGMKRTTLQTRLRRGESEADAISRPVAGRVMWTHRGGTLSVADWSRETGIKYATLMARYHRGWTAERALGSGS